MAADGGKPVSGRPTLLEEFQLPRTIDPSKFVQAREPEILALYEAIKGSDQASKINGSARHLRRRTASHNPHSHRRRPNLAKGENIDEAACSTSFTNRRMRRKWKNLRANALEASRWTEATVMSEAGDPERPARRLETHLWHSKRFLMSKDYWGWTLPQGIPGSGRGSRSILATDALMHDASYWCPMMLEGSMEQILNCMKRVLDPKISASILRWAAEGVGDWEIDVWLHMPDKYPFGAVSPARILRFSHLNLENDALCVWVHAAAASEMYNVLSVIVMETGGVALRIADLRRLEVRGNASTKAMDSALYRGQPNALSQCLDRVQPGDVYNDVLTDPRLAKPVVLGQSSATLLRPEVLELQKNTINTVVDATEASLRPISDVDISHLRGELRNAMALGAIESDLCEIAPSVGNVCFPVALVRQGSSVPGWSIILPAGWVLPVWQALVFAGCRVLGQREWRWIHTIAGNPFFPHDSPDTPAYREYVQETLPRKAAEQNASRPKGKAAPASKYLPADWNGVLDAWSDGEPNQGYFVARSESAMLKGLFGSEAPDDLCCSVGSKAGRPVFNALKAGKLQWQPVQPESAFSDQTNRRQRCLVEALVYLVKRGAALDGARLCLVVNREADWSSQPWYIGEDTSSSVNTETGLSELTSIPPHEIVTFGYVTSPAPYGSPRASASIAVCSAAAFWKLRGVQYYEPRRDRGMIHAWLQNPSSTALFPVRLKLLMVEKTDV